MPLSFQAGAAELQQISKIDEVQTNKDEPNGDTSDLINNFDTWLPSEVFLIHSKLHCRKLVHSK